MTISRHRDPGMDIGELASHIDHTVLRADARQVDVEQACQVARELGCAAVCVNPIHVALANRLLRPLRRASTHTSAPSIRAWARSSSPRQVRHDQGGSRSRRRGSRQRPTPHHPRRSGALKMSMNVAEHLVDLMFAAGIRHVYGMVGDSANPVIDAIRRAADELTFVPVRNEEAGAFAAGAEAMITGRPAAVIGSSGPGSLHLLNGLYDCDRNGAPVFAIVTHVPSSEIGTDYFQETRPELIFADCTRYIGYVTSPSQMPRLAALASSGSWSRSPSAAAHRANVLSARRKPRIE